MNDALRNILAGMGSVMAIMPVGDISKITVPKKTDVENLQQDWQRVGQDLYASIEQVKGEQEKEPQIKRA